MRAEPSWHSQPVAHGPGATGSSPSTTAGCAEAGSPPTAWGEPAAAIVVWEISLAGARDLVDGDVAAMLDEAERARAQRLVLDADRVRFVASHLALRCVLATILRVAPGAVRLARGPHGKPRLAAGQDDGLRFNLSQSGELALVAVARDVALGVDVERVRAWPAGVPTDLLGPAERRRLEALPAAQRAREFARCWTALEATAKARGTGLRTTRDVAAGDGRRPAALRALSGAGRGHAALPAPPGEGSRPVPRPASPRDRCRLAGLAAPFGYAASVAWQGGPRAIVRRSVSVGALVEACAGVPPRSRVPCA